MDKILYDEVMHHFYQGKNYGCMGNNYEDINWYEENEPKPTKEQLESLWQEIKDNIDSQNKLREIRAKIEETAGDTETLLGTTANASQMLLFAFSKLITGLNGAKSIAEIKKVAEPFEKMCADFLDKIEKKEVVLPYALDKLDDVMAEIGERATKVAKVLEEAKSA
jgi:hypothetical protein